MDVRDSFKDYIFATNRKGSRKASSYLRALDMLGEILSGNSGPFSKVKLIWAETSPNLIGELYEYIKEQQKSGTIFQTEHAPSYWKNGYYSAGLKAYQSFLIEARYESDLLNAYRANEFNARDFEFEIPDREILIKGVESVVGLEILRHVKTRVNQQVFRKKILEIYGGQCCITGLNIPQLNIASHIIPWSHREDTRLDPANGLCLSATYDKAFDSHLITLDSDHRIVVDPLIKEFYTKEVVKEYFHRFEGRQINRPTSFWPNEAYLAVHRQWFSSMS